MLLTDNSGALVAPEVFKGERMKILIKRDTVCGHIPVFAGSVIDASDSDARILIMAGKAEEFTGDEESKPKIRTRKKADESGE